MFTLPNKSTFIIRKVINRTGLSELISNDFSTSVGWNRDQSCEENNGSLVCQMQ